MHQAMHELPCTSCLARPTRCTSSPGIELLSPLLVCHGACALQVCVTMSDQFLQASATHDANDLSSVVSAGGHWCICAWAWASAVSRDPTSLTPEGITLDCGRTNLKASAQIQTACASRPTAFHLTGHPPSILAPCVQLREVYESHIQAGADLHSPSGAAYKAKAALDAVNRVCGGSNGTVSVAGTPATAASTAAASGAVTAGAVPTPAGDALSASALPPRHHAAKQSKLVKMSLFAAGAVLLVCATVALVRSSCCRKGMRRSTEDAKKRILAGKDMESAAGGKAAALDGSMAGDGAYESSPGIEVEDKLGYYDSAGCYSSGDEGSGMRVAPTPSTRSLLKEK